MRRTALLVVALLICVACATGPKYQLPQTEAGLQGTVETAEKSYKALYQEHKAGRLTTAAMGYVDALYESWHSTQQLLIDAVRSGSVAMKE